MENFSPLPSLLGGLLIGLSSAFLMVTRGRVAGVSGIAGKVVGDPRGAGWRLWMVLGLVVGGTVIALIFPSRFVFGIERSTLALIVGGLCVGVGTQLGSGCTSGHGICGLGRLSKRSFVAVVTFMATAAAVVAVVHHVFGGSV